MSPRWTGRIAGRTVVLVDDVLTSGATSDACVRVLKREGAARVVLACYARVVGGDTVARLPDGLAVRSHESETPGIIDPGRPA